ncbi:MAG: hypothetical protein ACRD1L_11195, partial [Terriglobales bacterium]
MSASGPIVSPTGVVLGGNSRTMALQRVYASGRGADYRQQLIESAGRFGLSGRAVAKLQQPVLVRVADQVPSDPRQLAQLGSDLNRNRTGALSDSELAASRGRALTPETLGQIGAMTDEMGGDATLADLLSRRPRQVMDLMARDGAVTDRERPALQDARTGALTPRGKDFVTKAMVGSVLPDAELLDATPAATLQKLARAAPQLARLANAAPEWDLHQPLQEAVALHARAAADAIPVGALLDQEDLFGHDATPETAALARALELPPRTFSQAVAHYVATASRHPVGQQLMPGFAAGTPQEALTEAFGGSEGRSPAAEGPATPRGATGYASLGGAEPAAAET